MPNSSTDRVINAAQAINEAIDYKLESDPNVFIMGLGVPDPKGIFGTTIGLKDKHGEERVRDMPLSENAMTGVVNGAAMVGMRPILVHQRIDFSLLALDQVLNQAAKWNYMFSAQSQMPIVIRMIIGRGWGQGPQHSQNLQALYAHFPGLKVCMPMTAYDAKGMLISAVEDNNPVVFLEHRWIYNLKDNVPEGDYRVPLGKANVIREGKDVTIAACSYMVVEALEAAEQLAKEGIDAEVIDLRTISPLDKETILTSVRKTGRFVMADTGWKSFGVSAELLAVVSEEAFSSLKAAPKRVALADHPVPTSWVLAREHYARAPHIMISVYDMLNKSYDVDQLLGYPNDEKLDTPYAEFTGPF